MSCVCGGVGVVKVAYRDQSAFDLGVCACRFRFRNRDDFILKMVADFYQISRDRVRWIEDLADDVAELQAWGIESRATAPDFTQAGQVGPKAHL